ncbi:MAG: toxin-antitoxin system TumE family protein [Gammaproteobacteria bacterium]
MRATELFKRRVIVAENAFAEIVAWKLPHPLPGSTHAYKYRLALIADGRCVLRYDNEMGKGDHRHRGSGEEPYGFSTIERLVADFFDDVTRWRDENSNA